MLPAQAELERKADSEESARLEKQAQAQAALREQYDEELARMKKMIEIRVKSEEQMRYVLVLL